MCTYVCRVPHTKKQSLDSSRPQINPEIELDSTGKGFSPIRPGSTSDASLQPRYFRSVGYKWEIPMTLSSGWINLLEPSTELKKTHLLTRLLIYFKGYASIDQWRVMMQRVRSFMMELRPPGDWEPLYSGMWKHPGSPVWTLSEERVKSSTFENCMEASLCSHDWLSHRLLGIRQFKPTFPPKKLAVCVCGWRWRGAGGWKFQPFNLMVGFIGCQFSPSGAFQRSSL